jgi:hypothetical protein
MQRCDRPNRALYAQLTISILIHPHQQQRKRVEDTTKQQVAQAVPDLGNQPLPSLAAFDTTALAHRLTHDTILNWRQTSQHSLLQLESLSGLRIFQNLNGLCHWVMESVLVEYSPAVRAAVIERAIDLATVCTNTNNHSTTTQQPLNNQTTVVVMAQYLRVLIVQQCIVGWLVGWLVGWRLYMTCKTTPMCSVFAVPCAQQLCIGCADRLVSCVLINA